MATTVHHRVGADVSLTERHPALMALLGLLCLVIVGGFVGVGLGRVLVLGVELLLGLVGEGR